MDGLLKLQPGFQLGAEEPSVRQPAPFRHMEQGGQKGVPANKPYEFLFLRLIFFILLIMN